MSFPSFLNRELPPIVVLLIVSATGFTALAALDYFHDFARLWDFRVYLKAKEHLAATGSPYFEAESLRFIYPPSSIFLLHLINGSDGFKSAYFVVNGTLWLATAALFCRRPIHLTIVFPVLWLAFGKHGYITILTGNIACILYFTTALSAWLYLTGRISTLVYSAVILALTLIKPFYAEFLIFVWFLHGLRIFSIASIAVVGLFFAINLLVYPDLFSQFLSALRFGSHDTEIFGITLMSHLSEMGFQTSLAALLHFLLIGSFFLAFLCSYPTMSKLQTFCCLFILSVFVNPKHITYDLMVAVAPLVILLLETRVWAMLTGFGLIVLATLLDLGIATEPYFQWWYAFVAAFAVALLAQKPNMELQKLPGLIANPASAAPGKFTKS